jgi:hypothetical protein
MQVKIENENYAVEYKQVQQMLKPINTFTVYDQFFYQFGGARREA